MVRRGILAGFRDNGILRSGRIHHPPVLMFYCHNMGEWRVMHPRPQRPRQRPAKASDFFPRVRERRLRLPQVPSVEALAKHFRRRYGVG